MQRLAQLSGRPDVELVTERVARPSTGPYFALGFLVAALAGTAAFLALSPVWGAQVSDLGERSYGLLRAAIAPWVGGPATPAISNASAMAQPGRPQAPLPESFDVAIDRRVKAHAAFGLQLVGADDRGVQVVLRDVPDTASLSHGTRQNASTWLLGAADLKALHLVLADGTPDAFDVRINVLADAGVTGLGSIARVRVVDVPDRPLEPSPAIVTVEHREPIAPVPAPAPKPAVELQVPKAAVASPPRGQVREDKNKSQPAAVQRHWPEGASALGAVTPSVERQVWWKMPPASWSPFQEPDGNSLP